MKKSGFWFAKVALKVLTLLFLCWEKYPHKKNSGLKSECSLTQEDSNKSSGNDLRDKDDLSKDRLSFRTYSVFFVKQTQQCLSRAAIVSAVAFKNDEADNAEEENNDIFYDSESDHVFCFSYFLLLSLCFYI